MATLMLGFATTWTKGVTGAEFLQLDPMLGVVVLIATIGLFHMVVGRRWHRH